MLRPRLQFAAAALLAACAGTETGNPSFTGQLSYNTHSSQPAVAALRVAEGGIQVDSAWLVLDEATFVDTSHCDAPDLAPAHAPGLGAGDHATPAAASTAFDIAPGSYCAVRLPFLRSDAVAAGPGQPNELPTDLPTQLTGHSILLQLTLPDGTPARIESAFQGEVSVAALDGAFELDGDAPDLLIAFDVATWLDGIGLDRPDLDRPGESDQPDPAGSGDDQVLINTEHNAAILAAFEARLAAGVSLYRDPEASGQVQATAAPIAQGE